MVEDESRGKNAEQHHEIEDYLSNRQDDEAPTQITGVTTSDTSDISPKEEGFTLPQTTPEIYTIGEGLSKPKTAISMGCGTVSADGSTHCISYGEQLPSLVCLNYQAENIPRAKFCANCGQER